MGKMRGGEWEVQVSRNGERRERRGFSIQGGKQATDLIKRSLIKVL